MLLESVGLFDLDDVRSYQSGAHKSAATPQRNDVMDEEVSDSSSIAVESSNHLFGGTKQLMDTHINAGNIEIEKSKKNSDYVIAGGSISTHFIADAGEDRCVSGAETDRTQASAEIRNNGLFERGPSLHIDISRQFKIQETDDNTELIRNLRDQCSLLSCRHLPTVKKWLEVNSVCSYVI